MNPTAKYLIFFLIALGLLAVLGYLSLFPPLPSSSQWTGGNFPTGGTNQPIGGGTGQSSSTPSTAPASIPIGTVSGGTVLVKPFLPSNSTTSPVASKSLIAEELPDTAVYNLIYYPDGSFGIVLLREPLKEARRLAEEDFVSRLGITREQACQIKYRVVVAPWVNPLYAGLNIGMSFCLASVRL